jgi:hypothetical protein
MTVFKKKPPGHMRVPAGFLREAESFRSGNAWANAGW